MRRYGQTVLLKDEPEVIQEYEEYHANIWPEVVEQLKKVGIRRMYIYRYGRQLFQFMEVEDDFDLERDLPKYAEHPKAKEWDELMASYQEPVAGAPPDSTWVQMDEVFAME